ncbi:MAG: hypothetical protein Q9P14_11760 [candidate division KSB1 bacterium]|nr:hypothetical protein [candidate division KSB1 bacterium]
MVRGTTPPALLAKAMMALVPATPCWKFGGDSLNEIRTRYDAWQEPSLGAE